MRNEEMVEMLTKEAEEILELSAVKFLIAEDRPNGAIFIMLNNPMPFIMFYDGPRISFYQDMHVGCVTDGFISIATNKEIKELDHGLLISMMNDRIVEYLGDPKNMFDYIDSLSNAMVDICGRMRKAIDDAGYFMPYSENKHDYTKRFLLSLKNHAQKSIDMLDAGY